MEAETRHSRSIREYLDQIERKKLLEILECEKQFKAKPVPDYIRRNVVLDCKKNIKGHSNNIHVQKKKEIKSTISTNLKSDNQISKFKSDTATRTSYKNDKFVSRNDYKVKNGMPNSAGKIFKKNSTQINSKIRPDTYYSKSEFSKEVEFIKDDEEDGLIENAYPQPQYVRRAQSGHVARPSEFDDPSFTPKINKFIPDFDHQFRMFLRKSSLHSGLNSKSPTICKPFNLHPPSPSSDSGKLTHTNTSNNNIRRASSTDKLLVFMDAIPPRMTQSALLRYANIKNKKLSENGSKEKTVRSEELKKINDKDLAKIVKDKAYASDINHLIEQKLKSHRQDSRNREINYLQELRAMKDKLKERPLLLEQYNQKKIPLPSNYKENHLNIDNVDNHFGLEKQKSTRSNSPSTNIEYSKDETSKRSSVSRVKHEVKSKSISRSSSQSSQQSNKSTGRKKDRKSKSDKELDSSSSSSSEESKKSQDKKKKKKSTNSSKTSKESNLSHSDKSRKSSIESASGSSKNEKSSTSKTEKSKNSLENSAFDLENIKHSKINSISSDKSNNSTQNNAPEKLGDETTRISGKDELTPREESSFSSSK